MDTGQIMEDLLPIFFLEENDLIGDTRFLGTGDLEFETWVNENGHLKFVARSSRRNSD